MFSRQINSHDNQTKTIYTVEKWRLIVNKSGQRYQLSLIDKWDMEQPIHQFIIYKQPEENQNASTADLLKQMFEGKSSNKLQLLKHEGSFIVIYGPYGLLGGGKTQQWIAGTTSIIGIIGGVVIVFNGNPLGKILIDTSTDLLIHACLAPEVTTDNCLETVVKSAVISVVTNSVFALTNLALNSLNSAKEIEKVAQPLSNNYLKIWNFLKKSGYLTLSSLWQKFVSQSFRQVVDEGKVVKDVNIFTKDTLKNLSLEVFIAVAACGTSVGMKEFLQNNQGILDLRTKNIFISWNMNHNLARILGRSIDNGIQSSAQTFMEEYCSSKLKSDYQFDYASQLKIVISGVSSAVYGGVGKLKKIQIENIFSKYEQAHKNFLSQRDTIVNEYGIFIQIYRKIINRLSFEPEKFNIQVLQTHMKIHFQLANRALIQREMNEIQKQDENQPVNYHVTYYNTLEETNFLSDLLKTSRDNEEILERVKQRSQLILNRFGLNQTEVNNKLNSLDMQIKDNLLMFVNACDEFQRNNYSLEKLSDRHYNTYINAKLAFNDPQKISRYFDDIDVAIFVSHRRDLKDRTMKIMQIYEKSINSLKSKINSLDKDTDKEKLNKLEKYLKIHMAEAKAVGLFFDKISYKKQTSQLAFEASPVFHINRSILQLSHEEIQQEQSKVGEKIIKLINQDNLLNSKFETFINAYSSGKTDEDFKKAKILLDEFLDMDGAEDFLKKNPEKSKFLKENFDIDEESFKNKNTNKSQEEKLETEEELSFQHGDILNIQNNSRINQDLTQKKQESEKKEYEFN